MTGVVFEIKKCGGSDISAVGVGALSAAESVADVADGTAIAVAAKKRKRDTEAGAYSDFEGGFGDGDSRLEVIMQREDENIKKLAKGKDAPVPPAEKKKIIKWCEFNVPYEALVKAMNYDIQSHKKSGVELDWIEMLALLAVKYYGNFASYKAKDLDKLAADLKEEKDLSALRSNKYYGFYLEVYRTVLDEYLGYYKVTKPDPENPDKTVRQDVYGLKVFSPIAAGYGYSHYDDFGNSRNYGYKRRHLGHDMMGGVGTPIIAVESGTVTEIGWNRYGGWRIGIRSADTKRYYYYAHLRKDKPYAKDFKRGDDIDAGDVIGFLGMTGYSTKENVNNIKPPHLHFGLQLIFDESQIKGPSEIWVDVYALSRLLQKNRSVVVYDKENKTYVRKPEY
ncbi:MAG: M23 family metallopeptidase [Clostridiales bacterium]|nr:M23 family metallopeptidase [Clostridiales bacterium]